jgi:hypothetical protein
VQLDDDRVLYLWIEDGTLYQAYAPSSIVYLQEDNWVDETTDELWLGDDFEDYTGTRTTSTFGGEAFAELPFGMLPDGLTYIVEPGQMRTPILTGIANGRATVFQIGSEIYFSLVQTNRTDDNNMATYIYRRIGNTEWVLHGTVYTDPYVPSDFGFIGTTSFEAGAVTVTPGGAWLIPTGRQYWFSLGPSAHDWNACVYRSTDGGVTWTLKYERGGGGNGRGLFMSREIQTGPDGTVYFTSNLNVNGCYVATSTDGGLTWADNDLGGGGAISPNYILVDDTYFYLGTDRTVSRTTTPLIPASWETVYTYESSWNAGKSIVQPLQATGEWSWTDDNGDVFGVVGVIPPLRQRQRDDGLSTDSMARQGGYAQAGRSLQSSIRIWPHATYV